MKMINGQVVPEHLSMAELSEMLESSNLQTVALACEVLKNAATIEAYELLKQHLDPEDRYKFREILAVIFDFEESAELKAYFLDALQSDSRMFVCTVLKHLIHKNIWVSDEQVLTCFEKNHGWINSYYYQILQRIAKTPQYTERVIWLFHTARTNSVKISIAECMKFFASQDNYMRLFGLLANSSIIKLRMEACRIACKFERRDLLQRYINDPDGHIRKYVNKALH